MKKLLLICAALLTGIGAQAQEFAKGDTSVSLTIGAGMTEAKGDGAMFDQHFNMEWGIASFGKFTIGVGFAVNNSYGGKYESMVAGEYDYSYTYYYTGRRLNSHNRWFAFNENKEMKRSGFGTADADIARDDIDLMFMASLHYSPIPKLDTYIKLGIGVDYMTYITSNYRNENGFSEKDYKHEVEHSSETGTIHYYYNDIDHVVWNGLKSKVLPAISTYVGATYYITGNWGVDVQFGLISGNLGVKEYRHSNSYGLFAAGATYKF